MLAWQGYMARAYRGSKLHNEELGSVNRNTSENLLGFRLRDDLLEDIHYERSYDCGTRVTAKMWQALLRVEQSMQMLDHQSGSKHTSVELVFRELRRGS